MEKAQIKVEAGKTVGALGDLYGIFFEDLNHAADGGLYAEMVQNRAFEYSNVDNPSYHPLMAWEKIEGKNSRMQWWIQDSHPYSRKNPHYLVWEIFEAGEKSGIRNTGYEPGMYFAEQETYLFSCLAANDGRDPIPMKIVLEDEQGTSLAEQRFSIAQDKNWNRYECELVAEKTCKKGSLVLYAEGIGRLYLDMISLFPKHTYKERKNGLRNDIAQMLADLKPNFMRFPGGCLVHDGSLHAEDRDSLYRWKNTIGSLEDRAARRNNWGYHQTLGLGYYEYFCFCEDIGAKPLPVLPAGYDPHHQRKVCFEQLEEWVQEALDLIEFANGDADSEWGSVRAALGHAKPFGLEYIGIGNEEVGEGFFERYPYFHKAIKARYPDIKIIASSGPFAAGGEYEKGWKCAREQRADYVDEHYYQAPEWFLANHHRYDDFPSTPKVFLGEYASWGNTWYNALVEASYMIGLERNAETVGLACYAPLLCHVNYVNWKPDMIWFNQHQVFGSANYYVQKLFMNHQGDERLAITVTGLSKQEKKEDDPIGGFGLQPQPDTTVCYQDICIEDMEGHTIGKPLEEKAVVERLRAAGFDVEQGLTVTADSQAVILQEITEPRYRIKMKATRLAGRRGFMLQYGYVNLHNAYHWEIGGWQNMDSALTQDIEGRNSCLTQSTFQVETDRSYELCLEVDGRKLKAYIDGELIHEINHEPVVIQPLYQTASIDKKTGDIIVKLVNVRKEPIDARIEITGLQDENRKGIAYCMAGYELTDENSFDEPLKVSPKEHEILLEQGACNYQIPGESVNVLSFR